MTAAGACRSVRRVPAERSGALSVDDSQGSPGTGQCGVTGGAEARPHLGGVG
ncbi:hypothetical protein [Streptomyces lydicus]|uniref:hypothetical protein n=1 Tax=Streptomyces lydicus TaxID=47763 RepID=UPI0036ED32BF